MILDTADARNIVVFFEAKTCVSVIFTASIYRIKECVPFSQQMTAGGFPETLAPQLLNYTASHPSRQ